MADSKEETIVGALVTNLQGITIANGYVNDLASVQRFEMAAQLWTDTPLAIVQVAEVNHKNRVQPNVVWEMATVLIGVYVRHNKLNDARSTDAILLSLDADIYEAVMQDLTLGGLTKTISRASVFFDEIQEPILHMGHISEFMVEYTHLIDSASA